MQRRQRIKQHKRVYRVDQHLDRFANRPEFHRHRHVLAWSVLFLGLVLGAQWFLFTHPMSLRAISNMWTFDTASEFMFDSEEIVVSGGVAALASIDQLDDDDTASGFGGGLDVNTQYDVGNSWLEMDTTGLTAGVATFTSRIIDAGGDVSWKSVSWVTNRPLHKELPNNDGIETSYVEGNIDMTNNVALFHMNEASGSIIDTSGNSNDASVSGGVTYGADGMFNTALTFNGTTGYLTIPNTNDINTGGPYEQRVVSAWFRIDDASLGKQVIYEEGATVRGLNIYTDSGVLYVGGWNTDAGQNDWDGTWVSTTISSDTWYHVVAALDVSQTTATETDAFASYLNGVEFGTGIGAALYAHGGDNQIGRSGGTRFHDGPDNSDDHYFAGEIDELAIWNTSFTGTNIEDLYKRGALRLGLQVRSCDDASCAGESFVGPGGLTTSTFSEINTTTIALPPTSTFDNIVDNRFFQYRVLLETDDSGYSPELVSVRINPAHVYAGDPFIQNTVGIPYMSLNNFSETLGLGNQGTVQYQVSTNGDEWYYFDTTSSAWTQTASTTFNVTSPSATINTQLSSFNAFGGGVFSFRAFLHSPTGTTQVELDEVDLDYEPQYIAFVSSTSSIIESGGSVSIPLTLTTSSAATTSVSFTLSGSAVQNTDYSVASTTILYAPFAMLDIPITIIDDSSDSSNMTVLLTFTTSTGAVLGTTTVHTLTIVDDDEPGMNDDDDDGGSSGGGGGVKQFIDAGAFSGPTSPEDGFRIVINSNAPTTTESEVMVKLYGGDDAVTYALSNTTSFQLSKQVPYTYPKTEVPWSLCPEQSDCESGIYTVYAKFFTEFGQSSNVLSDAIAYDPDAGEIVFVQDTDMQDVDVFVQSPDVSAPVVVDGGSAREPIREIIRTVIEVREQPSNQQRSAEAVSTFIEDHPEVMPSLARAQELVRRGDFLLDAQDPFSVANTVTEDLQLLAKEIDTISSAFGVPSVAPPEVDSRSIEGVANNYARLRALTEAFTELLTAQTLAPVVTTYFSFGSIDLSFIAINPTGQPYALSLSSALPEEISRDDIRDVGKATLGYDVIQDRLTIDDQLTLSPKSVDVRSVSVVDVWRYDDRDLKILEKDAKRAWRGLIGSAYEARGLALRDNIVSVVSEIRTSQQQIPLFPEEHIEAHRLRVPSFEQALTDLEELERLRDRAAEQSYVVRRLDQLYMVLPWLVIVGGLYGAGLLLAIVIALSRFQKNTACQKN